MRRYGKEHSNKLISGDKRVQLSKLSPSHVSAYCYEARVVSCGKNVSSKIKMIDTRQSNAQDGKIVWSSRQVSPIFPPSQRKILPIDYTTSQMVLGLALKGFRQAI